MATQETPTVSVQQLPPKPRTDLNFFVARIGEPDLPEAHHISDEGHRIVLDDEREVPDGAGGTQTAYRGLLFYREQTLAEFELRTGSSLVTVWNRTHWNGYHNFLRVKFGLDCLEHYSDGGSRSEYWRFALPRADAAIVRDFGAGRSRLSLDGKSLDDVRDSTLDRALLDVDGILGPVRWYAPDRFDFGEEVQSLDDAYPVIEAWEANMPEHRRNAEYKSVE